MPETSILSDDFIRELMNVGEVDIVVGVPTYNDAAAVGQVVQAVRAGLLQYFPRARAVIVNADGGSRDGTQELVRAASISDLNISADVHALRTLHSISTQYDGGPANGIALHTILAAADLLQAKACAVISPESTMIEPQWVERLLNPVIRDSIDMVLPVYRRHKFDGLLIRNLIYPLTRAVYGCHVREPYPSDFAFSGVLGSNFLSQDIWKQEQGRSGTELWFAISTITNRCKITQSFLGTKARPENAPTDLVKAMRESAGTLFASLRLNRKRLYQMFAFGMKELEPVFLSILTPETHAELKRLAELPEDRFEFAPDIWVRTVYEFAAAYHRAVIGRDHVVQALVPLFRGRAVTFLTQNREASAEEVESNIESLCQTFEHEKPYLLQSWNGGK
ncbi:MAG: hypothetical protein DMG93_19350 [Acidobacteria bacterium]|nr:MAG: hypothetical protein DMG93_19350 [Acidobacteriota bacterium]